MNSKLENGAFHFDGMILLKSILKNNMGWRWLDSFGTEYRTDVGSNEMPKKPFIMLQMLRISWLDKELLIRHEGLNEGSAETGKTFWELVHEVQAAPTGAILGHGAAAMEVIVSPVSEMEKYSGILLQLKT